LDYIGREIQPKSQPQLHQIFSDASHLVMVSRYGYANNLVSNPDPNPDNFRRQKNGKRPAQTQQNHEPEAMSDKSAMHLWGA